MSFLAELRRRNVIRMAGLYVVGAWLVVQVAETLLPAFDVPAWVLRAIIIVLALGFVPALVFSWIFELTPDGLKRDADVDPSSSIAPQTGRRMDRVLFAVMALALAYFALDKFVLGSRPDTAPPATAESPGTPGAAEPGDASVATPTHAASIAVLPFVNMSSDPEQEFFSDGLSEELLNRLAQVPKLRVIARTSSFSFKDKDVDVATIARALDVANVLEGSVRRSGDTLRITAQLIRAADSSHLWSRTYDRQMTDVFKVQDEISTEVVAALKLTLLPGESVPRTQRTNSVQAYEHFLRGDAILQLGRTGGSEEAEAELRQAIALDPGYANAWANLSFAQSGRAEATPDLDARNALIDLSKQSAEKAIALAPDLAIGYYNRSVLRFSYDLDWDGALADSQRAVALAPNDADALLNLGYITALRGGFGEALALARRAVEANPLSALAWENVGQVSLFNGDRDGARAAYRQAMTLSPTSNWSNYQHGFLDLQDGLLDSAQAHFERPDGGFPLAGRAMLEHSRGNEAASLQAIEDLKSQFGAGFAFQVASAYAWRGEIDQAFAWLDTALANRDAGMSRLRVDPTLAALRDDPRFEALARKVGLPE